MPHQRLLIKLKAHGHGIGNGITDWIEQCHGWLTEDSVLSNRLLNWPKLLEVYADGFYSIFVPECVPYIIPHMFHTKNVIYSLKILCFRPLLISFTHQNSGTNCMINMARVRFAH